MVGTSNESVPEMAIDRNDIITGIIVGMRISWDDYWGRKIGMAWENTHVWVS